MSSFTRINYKLRPAKSVERKMMGEAVMKLSVFYPLRSYQYVGFGSIYFADFSLFHKALGIGTMISIEHDPLAKSRVEFNKPFACIDVKFNPSTVVLPTIDLNVPSIIWLDYDGKLDTNVLSDINTVIANSIAGSLFLISVNAHAGSNSEDDKTVSVHDYRLKKLIEQVGKTKIPMNIEGKDLSAKNLPKVIRNIVTDQIEEALLNRNGALSNGEKVKFQQIFNFLYEDGAPMLTVGGLLLNESQQQAFSTAEFSKLDYCRMDSDIYKIEVPMLTTKEIVHLDSILHAAFDFNSNTLKLPSNPNIFLPEEDIVKYAKIYRYYPTFAEAVW